MITYVDGQPKPEATDNKFLHYYTYNSRLPWNFYDSTKVHVQTA